MDIRLISKNSTTQKFRITLEHATVRINIPASEDLGPFINKILQMLENGYTEGFDPEWSVED